MEVVKRRANTNPKGFYNHEKALFCKNLDLGEINSTYQNQQNEIVSELGPSEADMMP